MFPVILLVIFSQNVNCDYIRQFNKIPDNVAYNLNESVTLSCEVQNKESTLIVIFRQNGMMHAEGCKAYKPEKYEMSCPKDKKSREFSEYNMRIKYLEWTDRGNWECHYGGYKKNVTLDIKVPAIFKPLDVKPSSDRISNFKHVGSSFLSDTDSQLILKGRGSKSNPYNLRNGIALKITCISTCSYPSTDHKWHFTNTSHGRREITNKEIIVNETCSRKGSEGMISTKSEVSINCTNLHMVGANEIICSSESRMTKVYVLCAGGERPWELTTGEIIGMAASVGLFILLICLLCLMIKRSKSAYQTSIEESANLYNAAVKL